MPMRPVDLKRLALASLAAVLGSLAWVTLAAAQAYEYVAITEADAAAATGAVRAGTLT